MVGVHSVYLGFHFQNCKHLLEYFGFYLLTIVYTKKLYQEFLFICLFVTLQRQQQTFLFTNSAIKPQHVLFANKSDLRKMLVSFFSSNISLYIEKKYRGKIMQGSRNGIQKDHIYHTKQYQIFHRKISAAIIKPSFFMTKK